MESIIKELTSDELKILLSHYYTLPSEIANELIFYKKHFIYSGLIKPDEFEAYVDKANKPKGIYNMNIYPVMTKNDLYEISKRLSNASDTTTIRTHMHVFIDRVNAHYEINQVICKEIINSQMNKLVTGLLLKLTDYMIYGSHIDIVEVTRLLKSISIILEFTPVFILDYFSEITSTDISNIMLSLDGKSPYIDFDIDANVIVESSDEFDEDYMQCINGRILFNSVGNIKENVLSNIYQLTDSYFNKIHCETGTFNISENNKMSVLMDKEIESVTTCLTGHGKEFIIIEYCSTEYILSEIDKQLYAMELAAINDDVINTIKLNDDSSYKFTLECSI